MSNPTTPFGWQMPTNTDLVTDLPADFEVFGQAVATSMQDLLGGTTGQVLAKASNADMDFVWSADAAGMTNPMTTTGDIIYSTPNSTPVRRGIGSTGQVLTVAGGIPTWATPASGGGMTLISTTSLTGASVTLSSIPGTYVHLQLVFRNALPATDVTAFKIRFNSDSNTRYRSGIGYDGVTGGAMNATQGSLQPEADNAVSTFNLGIVNIYDYTNTTTAKFYYTQSITTNYTTTTSVNLETGFSVYNQTGAITDITLFPTTGNWTSGSVLLYGVK